MKIKLQFAFNLSLTHFRPGSTSVLVQNRNDQIKGSKVDSPVAVLHWKSGGNFFHCIE